MPIPKHAVIAAAGLGSRLGHGIPKCLLEIEQRPLIAYLLDLLEGVEDVRIVVGYLEQSVIKTVLQYRRDVVFVRNPNFRTTTTQTSYALGSSYLSEPCLYIDADILFKPEDFAAFLEACDPERSMIAVTEAKTDDAVFVDLDDERAERPRVTGFHRQGSGAYEWANLAWLRPGILDREGGAVFERLQEILPLAAMKVRSWEIDTAQDLERALNAFYRMRHF